MQFTSLVLLESISYPSKIDIVTEISTTKSILNRIESTIKLNPDLVNRKSVAIPSPNTSQCERT